MAQADIIREFLVSLGFKTDDKSLKKFTDGVDGATARVAGLVTAIAGSATVLAFYKFAQGMEALYFSTQKAGASAINMKAFEKAAQNFGAASGDALASVQSLARFMRNEPAAEGFIASLGINTRKANGELKDTTDLLVEIGDALRKKPYYLATQYAQEFGIGEDTLRAMLNGDFARELEKQRSLLKDSGYDEAAKQAHEFQMRLREVETRIEAVGVALGTYVLDALQNLEPFVVPILKTIADGWKNIYDWVKAAGEAINDVLPKSWGEKIGAGTAWLFDKLGIRGAVDNAMGISQPPSAASGSSAKDRLASIEKKYGLPSGLLDSVWAAESGRGQNMKSAAGAEGHFQFMPATARQYGLSNPYDFDQSADAAGRYYRDLMARYGGNLQKAVAAYNWGPGNVDRLGLGRAPAETQGYMGKVLGGMGVSVNQNTTINVTGGDPIATGRAVANEQDRVTMNMTRNLQTAVN